MGTRAHLLRAAELARSAADAATIAASYDRITPARAAHFARQAEEAAYAALDALAASGVADRRPDFLTVASGIVAPATQQIERAA